MSYSQLELCEGRHVNKTDSLTTCPVLRPYAVKPCWLAIRSFLRKTGLVKLICITVSHSCSASGMTVNIIQSTWNTLIAIKN